MFNLRDQEDVAGMAFVHRARDIPAASLFELPNPGSIGRIPALDENG